MPVILDPQDLQRLRDQNAILSFRRAELDMLNVALQVSKATILQKYGLDPSKNYQIDDRGIVVPFEQPAPEVAPAPDAPSQP